MKRLFIPFLALVFAVLACGPFGGSEPADDELAAPADASDEEGVGAAEGDADAPADEAGDAEAEESGSDAPGSYLFSGLGLDDHNSFSFEFRGQITPADPDGPEGEATFSGMMTVQRDPEMATWELFTAFPEGVSGSEFQTGGGGGSITGYLVDGILYSVIEVNGEETCVGIPETGDTLGDTMDILSGPDSFSDPKYHTEEMTLVESGVEVNGFVTDHYRAENVNNDDVESGTVDVWVIQGNEVPARMMLTGMAEDDTYGQVNVEWHYDLVGLDQAVEVAVPDNCAVVGGGDS